MLKPQKAILRFYNRFEACYSIYMIESFEEQFKAKMRELGQRGGSSCSEAKSEGAKRRWQEWRERNNTGLSQTPAAVAARERRRVKRAAQTGENIDGTE